LKPQEKEKEKEKEKGREERPKLKRASAVETVARIDVSALYTGEQEEEQQEEDRQKER
jgi:hypothetical protein